MSRDEILTLARDAGFVLCSDPMDESEKAALVRFAELVASRVRIKTAKQIEELQAKAITVDMWRGLALAKHGDGRTLGQIEREKAEAVAAEREACAKVCEAMKVGYPSYFEIDERIQECAEAIRERSTGDAV